MSNLFRRLHRHFWTRRAAEILRRRPFHWTAEAAASYANTIYYLYLDEGFGPAQAIECDRSYW